MSIELNKEVDNIIIVNKMDFLNSPLTERKVADIDVPYGSFVLYKMNGDKGKLNTFGASAETVYEFFK